MFPPRENPTPRNQNAPKNMERGFSRARPPCIGRKPSEGRGQERPLARQNLAAVSGHAERAGSCVLAVAFRRCAYGEGGMPDNLNVERRYPALSFIAITLKGVAFLVAGAGGLMAVLAFGSGGSGGSGGALMGTGMILASAVVV